MKNIIIKYFIYSLICFGLASNILNAQTPIDWGQSITDTINPASEIETYTTPVFAVGDIIYIRVSPVTGLIRPRIRLINQVGSVVATAQATASFMAVDLFWTVPIGAGGSYTIAVSDVNSTNTGQICVALHRFNIPPNAVLMECNSSRTSAIDCDASIKAFKYNVRANTLAEIVVTPITGLFKPQVWVCDASGNVITKDSTKNFFTAVSIIVPAQAQAQCFYVLVVDEEGTNTGNFSISQGVLAGDCATASIQSTAANGIVCAGNAFSLEAITNTEKPIFKWEGPNDFTSDQSTITFNNVTTAQAGTYKLTVTDENDCILITATQVIQVINLTANILPNPANGIVCEGSGFTLNVSTNAVKPTYVWSGPNGFTSTQPMVTLNNATTLQSGTYTVTITDENGCTITASRTITVISFTASLQSSPANGIVCAGSNFTLNVSTNAANPSYVITGPGGFRATQSSASFTNVTIARSGIYNVTVTDINGCTKTASKTITVVDFTASLQSTPTDGIVCVGEDVSIGASTSATNPVYRWVGPSNFTATSPTITLRNITTAQAGVYTVTITDENGCTKTQSKTIVVHPLPDVMITAMPADATVCLGDGVVLNATSNTGGVSYRWFDPSGIPISTQPSVSITPTQTGTYTVNVTNNATGCITRENKRVTVGSLPVLYPIAKDGRTTFTATGGNPPYTFTISGGDYDPGKIFADSISNVPTGTYNVMVTDANGCKNSAVLTDVDDHWVNNLGLTIAPNPSSGIFEIMIQNPPSNRIQLRVLNGMGQLLRTAILESRTTLDLTDLPTGLYFFQITDGEKVGSRKVLVTK